MKYYSTEIQFQLEMILIYYWLLLVKDHPEKQIQECAIPKTFPCSDI